MVSSGGVFTKVVHWLSASIKSMPGSPAWPGTNLLLHSENHSNLQITLERRIFFCMLEKDGTPYLIRTSSKMEQICSTLSIMCFQTWDVSKLIPLIFSKIVLCFPAILSFNKNTNTPRLTQACTTCFCVIENGFTFSGWISIFLPWLPSAGWSRFLSGCWVKYITTCLEKKTYC